MLGNQTGGNLTGGGGNMVSAKMHLEEGIKSLQSGDSQAAMIHLKAADKALGGTG
jgi:hypothetical protein